MAETILNFIKGDKVGAETDYRDALPVNMYGVIKPMFGAQGYMLQMYGLTEFSSGLFDNARGGVWNERFNEHFRVNGQYFYKVDEFGETETIGVLPPGGTVSLPYSFNTQGIVASGKFFLYDSDNGYREVTDSDLGDPIDCVWVDGYYFFTDGEFIYHTNIDNESEIDPLKFATAEFMPDASLGVDKTQDNKVMVFGRYTIEYFSNIAQENFAFQRVQSRAIKIGIVGTHCKTEVNGKHYILGGRKNEFVGCHAVAVGSTTKISTREVEKIIRSYDEIELSNSVVESFKQDGYTFILYHLPNDTLMFNETLAQSVGAEQAWTILHSDICKCKQWRAIHLVSDVRLSKWVAGDKEDPRLAYLDDTTGLQYLEPSEWELNTPFVYLDGRSINKLEIETIPGFTDSDDSSVFISCSKDGHTYSKDWIEIYGDKGDFKKRFIVRRLGYIRDWFSFRLRGLTKSRMAFARGFISHG